MTGRNRSVRDGRTGKSANRLQTYRQAGQEPSFTPFASIHFRSDAIFGFVYFLSLLSRTRVTSMWRDRVCGTSWVIRFVFYRTKPVHLGIKTSQAFHAVLGQRPPPLAILPGSFLRLVEMSSERLPPKRRQPSGMRGIRIGLSVPSMPMPLKRGATRPRQSPPGRDGSGGQALRCVHGVCVAVSLSSEANPVFSARRKGR